MRRSLGAVAPSPLPRKTMAKWLEYVFKHGDLDKDGQLDRAELQYLSDRWGTREERGGGKGETGPHGVWLKVSDSRATGNRGWCQ